MDLSHNFAFGYIFAAANHPSVALITGNEGLPLTGAEVTENRPRRADGIEIRLRT
jgi:hypothetical protein